MPAKILKFPKSKPLTPLEERACEIAKNLKTMFDVNKIKRELAEEAKDESKD